jgi:hypothetical protein
MPRIPTVRRAAGHCDGLCSEPTTQVAIAPSFGGYVHAHCPYLLLGVLALLFLAIATQAQMQTDAISREFTVFVDSAPPHPSDAESREFTVYVGNQPLRIQTDAVSHEFTAFVDSAPPNSTDAISREFTVYFGNQPLRIQVDAVTREFTVQFQNGCTGDFDGDGNVTNADLPYFIAALVDRDAPQAWRIIADFNCNGSADGIDIQPFVVAILGG